MSERSIRKKRRRSSRLPPTQSADGLINEGRETLVVTRSPPPLHSLSPLYPDIQIGEGPEALVLTPAEVLRVRENWANLGSRLRVQLCPDGRFRDTKTIIPCSDDTLAPFLRTALIYAWTEESFTLKRLERFADALPDSVRNRKAMSLAVLDKICDFEDWDWLKDIIRPVHITPHIAISRHYPRCALLQRRPTKTSLGALRNLASILGEACRELDVKATLPHRQVLFLGRATMPHRHVFFMANAHPSIWAQLGQGAQDFLREYGLQHNPGKPSLWIQPLPSMMYIWPPGAETSAHIKLEFTDENQYKITLPPTTMDGAAQLLQDLPNYFPGNIIGVLGYRSSVDIGTTENTDFSDKYLTNIKLPGDNIIDISVRPPLTPGWGHYHLRPAVFA